MGYRRTLLLSINALACVKTKISDRAQEYKLLLQNHSGEAVFIHCIL